MFQGKVTNINVHVVEGQCSVLKRYSYIIVQVVENGCTVRERKIEELLPKVNPLSCILNVKDLLAKTDDILDLDDVTKLLIKKDYKNFCRVHHPDKTNNIDENSVELYITL